MAFYSESCGIHLWRNIDRQDSTINKQTNKQTNKRNSRHGTIFTGKTESCCFSKLKIVVLCFRRAPLSSTTVYQIATPSSCQRDTIRVAYYGFTAVAPFQFTCTRGSILVSLSFWGYRHNDESYLLENLCISFCSGHPDILEEKRVATYEVTQIYQRQSVTKITVEF